MGGQSANNGNPFMFMGNNGAADFFSGFQSKFSISNSCFEFLDFS